MTVSLKTLVDDYIKRNITQRVEFRLEQVFNSITYSFFTPDPEPRVDDIWSQWKDRCDDLRLDVYLNTTEENKEHAG